MDVLLAVLAVFAAALAVVVVLLFRRIEGMRAELERLDQLGDVARRLDALGDRVERREFSAALQGKLTEFEEASARLAAAVAELRADVRLARAGEPPAEGVGAIVSEHLRLQGYDPIRLLTDVASLEDDSGRVAFEARRLGVTHKGHVVLEDGVIVDESVQAAWSAFP